MKHQTETSFCPRKITHVRDLEILLSEKIRNAFMRYNLISLRIITAMFVAAPCTITAIHTCVPTSAFPEEKMEAFHNFLEDTLAKTRTKDVIIMTDN